MLANIHDIAIQSGKFEYISRLLNDFNPACELCQYAMHICRQRQEFCDLCYTLASRGESAWDEVSHSKSYILL